MPYFVDDFLSKDKMTKSFTQTSANKTYRWPITFRDKEGSFF
jgi:hypothetical protein